MANDAERRAHNRKLAINLAKAGLYTFVSDGKVPLVLAWQRADTAIGSDGVAEIKSEARSKAERNGRTFDESTFVGATKDVAIIRKMFDRYPDAVPSISLGPSKLCVLDCDIDKSRHGPTLARQWLAEQGIDIAKCPVTISQSGGQHIFFSGEAPSRVPPAFKAMYIQAKGLGGQVIAPGARREDGKVYTSAPNHPALASAFTMGDLPPIPPAIAALLTEKREGTSDADTDALAAKLRTAELPEPLDASSFVADDKGGDRSAYRQSLANRMRAKGHSAEEYFSTLREAENAGAFVGDAAPSEGEFGLRNVARDWGQAERRHADGVAEAARIEVAAATAFKLDKPEVAFDAIVKAVQAGDHPDNECTRFLEALDNAGASAATLKAAQDGCDRLLGDSICGVPLAFALEALRGATGEKAAALDPRTGRGYKAESAMFADIELTAWTIDEILPEHGIGFIVGASHTGKTFACLDMMGHLAQGRDWFGRKVYEATCTLYIGGEDVEEIPGRIKAWTLKNGSTRDRLGVMDAPPNLTDAKAIKTIVGVVKHLKEDTGLRCGLIVLDTVASLAVGMKENAADEVGALTDLMRRIAKATGAAVLGVHHPRKGADASEGRGSGAFYNNATFEFRLVKKKGARRGSFQVHKNKFAALDMAGLPFQLDPVDLGTNRHGKTVTTLVFRQADACDFPAVTDDDAAADGDDDAQAVTGEPVEPLRGQDRVMAAARRAVAAEGGPVKRAAIAAEIEADGGAPLSGNSVGPLIARLVEEGALVRSGRQRYGVP